MKMLAFDTSCLDIQLALLDDGKLLDARIQKAAESGRQEAASFLIPAIDKMLKDLVISKNEIDLIVVGSGPGSFTGARVAVSTARTLAQALALPLVPISRLESLAYLSLKPLFVLLDAGAGKLYGAAFSEDLCSQDGGILIEPFCAPYSQVRLSLQECPDAALLLEPTIDVAEFADSGRDILSFPEEPNLARAAALLAHERVKQACKNGEKPRRDWLRTIYPWDNVLPLYLRSPSVTLKKADGNSFKTNSC